jgi:hypothetical protein
VQLTLTFSPFTCAMELLRSELSQSRRGWTICPARARPSWIIRGACPLHDLKEVRKWEEKKKNKNRQHVRVQNTLATILASAILPLLPPHLLRAKELPSVEICPTQRGWTFCPARARPSWIIRGACPLHDLMEVRKQGFQRARNFS